MDPGLRDVFDQRMVQEPIHELQELVENVVDEHQLPEQTLVALSAKVKEVHSYHAFFLDLCEKLFNDVANQVAKTDDAKEIVGKQEEIIAGLKLCAKKWTERNQLIREGNEAVLDVIYSRNPEVVKLATAFLEAERGKPEEEDGRRRSRRLHPYQSNERKAREANRKAILACKNKLVQLNLPVQLVSLLVKALKV